MVFGVPCWADDVLDALPSAVAAGVSGLTADRVFESLLADDDHLKEPPASDFAVVGVRGLTPRSASVTGGGRLTTVTDMAVRVALFARIGDDQALRDRRTLRDRTRSVLRKALRLVQALQMWRPVDAAGGCLLVEPGRLSGAIDFAPRKPGQGAAGWAVAATNWAFSFRAKLDDPTD